MADLKNISLFLLDMDGTIYLDNDLFDGTLDFLEYVRNIGGRYIFMTNNSSKSVDKYIEKCKYEGQINLLCKLKEGDILITKMTSTINTIIKHELAEIYYEEEKRYTYTGFSNYKKVSLTEEQTNPLGLFIIK